MLYTRFNAQRTVARWATLVCCMAVLLFASMGYSQLAGTGNIQGTVSDSTGAVVPNAPVTLTDQSTGVKRTAVSNSAGNYLFPGIPIGTYNLQVAAPGFKITCRPGSYLKSAATLR